ncbi:MAG: putative porin [Tannerella sp.]|nr:putative porin [Tannerella sp.]
MKQRFYIGLIIAALSITATAQNRSERGGGGQRGGFSLSSQNAAHLTDSSLLVADQDTVSEQRINAYHLTALGERYLAPIDTDRINAANRTFVEARSLGIAYTGNIGSPSQTRIFSERKEERDFIFADPYDYYIITPENAYFYDTKLPYSNVLYTKAGGSTNREEQFKVLMTGNSGKKINVGGDFEYIYSRGHYNSNGNKLLSYRFFGSYRSDRYEAYAHVRNFNFVNSENGGLTNDRYVTHPDDFSSGKRQVDTRSFPTRFESVWNRVRGKDIFLTHHYNLGFYREMTEQEQEKKKQKEETRENELQKAAKEEEIENEKLNQGKQPPDQKKQPVVEEEDEDIHADEVFVPVSSIIHTFEYEDNRRRFISTDPSRAIDTCYTDRFGKTDSILNDYTQGWKMANTVALSMREGFQDWAKFGLAAFVRIENRNFTLQTDSLIDDVGRSEFSTYIGGELSKRRGNVLTYQARGEFCIAGNDDIGEFRLTGDVQTRFRLLGKDASIQAKGHIYNVTPAFYQRYNHSRYFWWDNRDLNKIQRISAEGIVTVEQTRTQFSVGLESIQNYVYFDTNGQPAQYGKNLQVVTGRLRQNFRTKSFGWENELAYQLSSEESVLPLPKLSAYSNLYVMFKFAKVLSIQMGTDVRYHTSYFSPYYEPATQQFQLQDKLKTGNYPLMNAYVNFHLKQTRFFIEWYNVGSVIVSHPEYFSMPHYPMNPMVMKMGLSVVFNN